MVARARAKLVTDRRIPDPAQRDAECTHMTQPVWKHRLTQFLEQIGLIPEVLIILSH
jgi:hypothetical protein